MPGREEITSSVYGAFLLARRDARGMGFFEISIDGFWRSFFAAAIVAPIHIIIVSLHAPAAAEVSFAWQFVVETIRYGLEWATFPVIMVVVARLMDLSHLYVAYIVAYNWSKVLIYSLWLPLFAIEATQLLPAWLTSVLMIAVFVAIMYYLWFITCTALRLAWYIGVALVAIEILASLVVDSAVDRILL